MDRLSKQTVAVEVGFRQNHFLGKQAVSALVISCFSPHLSKSKWCMEKEKMKNKKNMKEGRVELWFRSVVMRGRLVVWILGAMVFLLFAQSAAAASLSINGAEKYQTIDGFGTNINSLSWTNDNSKAAIDLLADQMGQTLWRVVFDMEDWEATKR